MFYWPPLTAALSPPIISLQLTRSPCRICVSRLNALRMPKCNARRTVPYAITYLRWTWLNRMRWSCPTRVRWRQPPTGYPTIEVWSPMRITSSAAWTGSAYARPVTFRTVPRMRTRTWWWLNWCRRIIKRPENVAAPTSARRSQIAPWCGTLTSTGWSNAGDASASPDWRYATRLAMRGPKVCASRRFRACSTRMGRTGRRTARRANAKRGSRSARCPSAATSTVPVNSRWCSRTPVVRFAGPSVRRCRTRSRTMGPTRIMSMSPRRRRRIPCRHCCLIHLPRSKVPS